MQNQELNLRYECIYAASGIFAAPHRIVGRCHPFVVMICVRRGMYCCRTADALYEIAPGQTILIPEFIKNDVHMPCDSELSWAFLRARQDQQDVFHGYDRPLVFDGSVSKTLEQAARQLVALKSCDNAAGTAGRDAQVALIVHTVLSHTVPAAASEAYSWEIWRQEVSSYILKHLREKPCLSQLAAHFCMSVSGFSHRFTACFHRSAVDYWINEKIHASVAMLMESRTVKSIATELCFYDEYHYSRMFKKYMGLSPDHYRKTQISFVP